MVNVKHVIMRKKIEAILSRMVKGEDEPEQTLDKLCDLHSVSKASKNATAFNNGYIRGCEDTEANYQANI